MKEFSLYREIWLARPRPAVFAFFAEAANLQALTPPWLDFEIVTPGTIVMSAGAMIDYRIRIHGLPIRWRTRIEAWQPPECFVDVQLQGPYRLWHHTHEFKEHDGGTLCIDRVRYRPRGGAIMNWLFVKRDLRKIFNYRHARLLKLFQQTDSHA